MTNDVKQAMDVFGLCAPSASELVATIDHDYWQGKTGEEYTMDYASYFHFIEKEVSSIIALMKNKNKDYTAGGGPFVNFEQAKDFGINPLLGLSLRMGDKFKRVQSYFKNQSMSVESEGIEDAYRDLIGYSLIALAMLEEKRRKGE